jgi:hypothetical protein
VLFAGTVEIAETAVATIAATPPGITVFGLLDGVMRAIIAIFEPDKRDWCRRRQAVVDHSPELRERELLKRQAQNEAITAALRERGLDGLAPDLVAALIGVALHVTFTRWIEAAEDQDIAALAAGVLAELRATVTTLYCDLS